MTVRNGEQARCVRPRETPQPGQRSAGRSSDVAERSQSSEGIVPITGSSGFLGRALADRLKARYRIVGLDLFPPSQDPGFETIRLDLTDAGNVRKAMGEVAAKY